MSGAYREISIRKKNKQTNNIQNNRNLLLIHWRQDVVSRSCSQHTSVLHTRFVPMGMDKAMGDTHRLIKKKVMGRKTARVKPNQK